MIRLLIILCLIIGSSNYSEAQFVQDNESIMNNIVLLNKKISNLTNRIKTLKNELNQINEINTDEHLKIRNGLDSLIIKIDSINYDLQNTLDQFRIYTNVENEKQNVLINNLINDLFIVEQGVDANCQQLENVLLKFLMLPDIFLIPDTIPMYSANLELINFFTFGQTDLKLESVYSLGTKFRFDKNSFCWIEYITPFELFVIKNIDGSDVLYSWSTQMIGAGYSYQDKIKSNSNLNFILSGGLFYGYLANNKISNSLINNDKNYVKGLNTQGFSFKFGLSYNQFYLKNPFEIYLYINNLVSVEKIVLQTKTNNKFDLGAYLISLSLGLNFWFW